MIEPGVASAFVRADPTPGNPSSCGRLLDAFEADVFDSPDETDSVELLDVDGRPFGRSAKLPAHRSPGLLHRGFSVFVFDETGRLLLQRRAGSKYHFGGRWSNACCGHPPPGADVVVAARRRTGHELGLDVSLEKVGVFRYRAEDPASGLVEHEDDTVLVGRVAAATVLAPHPEEVSEVRWIEPSELLAELAGNPESFTPWFAEALECLLAARR